MPSPSISTSQVSAGVSMPTPAGVPVMIRSPGSSRQSREQAATISSTFQMSCARSPSCLRVPAMSSQIAMYQNTILKLRDRAEKAEKAAAAARGASQSGSPQRGRSFR